MLRSFSHHFCDNSILLTGNGGKEEDILRHESQDSETQIYRHPQQINGNQRPSYTAL